jgi:TonB-dependent SusC/RagA subfamily outer membrane receptor
MEPLRRVCFSLFTLITVVVACAPAPPRRAASDVSLITSEDLQDPREPIESVIQKKVPGVVVTRSADGGIALQVRGATTSRGNVAPPLFILNGLPFRPGPDGALTGVNPTDIESIKVLKGAEAGIYGIDGANGVIVITTKHGGKP